MSVMLLNECDAPPSFKVSHTDAVLGVSVCARVRVRVRVCAHLYSCACIYERRQRMHLRSCTRHYNYTHTLSLSLSLSLSHTHTHTHSHTHTQGQRPFARSAAAGCARQALMSCTAVTSRGRVVRKILCWLLVMVSTQAQQQQHDPNRAVLLIFPPFFSAHHSGSPVWTQLHVQFRFPFSCSGAVYAVAFALKGLDPKKTKQFHHRFTEEHLLDQTELILRLSAVESGEYHIHVDIFDTFPGLYEDDALLARMGTTHPIFIPEIAFPLGLKWNQVGSQKPPYLLRHSGGVESGNSKQQHLDRLALIRAFQSAGIEINLRGNDSRGGTEKVSTTRSPVHTGARQVRSGARAMYTSSRWLLNVLSQTNYTRSCCQFGSQLEIATQGAFWSLEQFGDNQEFGWVVPGFISQPRNNTAMEEMIQRKTTEHDRCLHHRIAAQDSCFVNHRTQDPHYILDTLPVAWQRLFQFESILTESRHQNRIMTLDEAYSFSNATIDHLIVTRADVIGGQACVNPSECNLIACETSVFQSEEDKFHRKMEFYGREFTVKRISCLPYASFQEVDKFLRTDPRKFTEKIVAVSVMGSNYGQSAYNLALDIQDPTHGKENKDDMRTDFQDIFSRLSPSNSVLEMADAFCERYFLRDRNDGGGAGAQYRFIAAHWRRGDRGHSEMEAYGADFWRISQPRNFACIINKMVLESGITRIFVATNSGSEEDKFELRDSVWRG